MHAKYMYTRSFKSNHLSPAEYPFWLFMGMHKKVSTVLDVCKPLIPILNNDASSYMFGVYKDQVLNLTPE